MGSGEHFTLNSFSVTVPVGGCMQRWFLFAGLPWIPVADLEITGAGVKGGGGGVVCKTFFSALWASVWSRNKGGGGKVPPLDPPLDTSLL